MVKLCSGNKWQIFGTLRAISDGALYGLQAGGEGAKMGKCISLAWRLLP